MTAQNLKNAILQLAVQGKLVSQDSHDEPASELLKRIKTEKALLIKDGKIKKEKPFAAVVEDDTPFEIPEKWIWLRFGDFCAVYNGDSINATVKQEKYSKPCEGWSFIATKDVGFNHEINYENGIYIPYHEDSFKIAPAGSVLLCMEGGSAGRKIGVLDRDVCFGNKLCCFTPIAVFNRYLYYYLQCPQFFSDFMGSMTGLIGGVGAAKLKNIAVPIPPLAEQQRIVTRIEELMPLVEEYGKAEERLTALNAEFPDKLRKSILQQAIQGKLTERDPADEPASNLLKRIRAEKERLIKEGKIKKEKPLQPITEEEMPFEIPENWAWVRFVDLTETIGDGIHGTPVFDPNGNYYFINGNNLVNGKIVFKDSTQKVSKTEYELYKKPLTTNTVLLSINGTIGNIAYYNNEPVILGKSACYIALINNVNKEYISLLLGTKLFFDYAVSKATKTTIANVSLKAMRMFPIPLPPLAEQQRIVDRVNELLAVCDELR